MPTRVQGQRDVALTSLPFRGIAINDASANTNAVTVYASDSGILFINEFQTETTYTLPAVADCKGKIFFFYCNYASAIKILGASGDEDLINGATTGQTSLADDVTSGTVIGNWGAIIGDGSTYFFVAGIGIWTGSG